MQKKNIIMGQIFSDDAAKKKKSDKCRQIHIMGQKSLVTNVYKCDDYTN